MTGREPRDAPLEMREQQILEERAAALAQALVQTTAQEEGLDLMTFRVGAATYGVPIEMVREIQPLDARTWSRIPCTPPFVVGAVNIRGHIYSILNIATFMGGAPATLSDDPHVLLVSGGQTESGEVMDLCVVADDIPVTRIIPEEEIQVSSDAIPGRARAFVKGVTADMLILLDLDRLLSNPALVVNEEP